MRPPVNWKRSLAVLQGLLLVSPRRILAGGEHAARHPTDRGRTDAQAHIQTDEGWTFV